MSCSSSNKNMNNINDNPDCYENEINVHTTNTNTVAPIIIRNGQIINSASIHSESNDSNDVFMPLSDQSTHSNTETNFQLPRNPIKRARLDSPNSPIHQKSKKLPIFVSTNRFNYIATDDTIQTDINNSNNIKTNASNNIINNELKTTEIDQPIIKRPPPICVRGIGNIGKLTTKLTKLIGTDNLFFKASLSSLKIQTATPDTYRKTIHHLKENNALFHTYQLREEKTFRIVKKFTP